MQAHVIPSELALLGRGYSHVPGLLAGRAGAWGPRLLGHALRGRLHIRVLDNGFHGLCGHQGCLVDDRRVFLLLDFDGGVCHPRRSLCR
eukprot:5987273-Pyramimonas_sp.AAC.1